MVLVRLVLDFCHNNHKHTSKQTKKERGMEGKPLQQQPEKNEAEGGQPVDEQNEKEGETAERTEENTAAVQQNQVQQPRLTSQRVQAFKSILFPQR
jgi:hypothetical protein